MSIKFVTFDDNKFSTTISSVKGFMFTGDRKIVVYDDSSPLTDQKYIFNGTIPNTQSWEFPNTNQFIDLFNMASVINLGILSNQPLSLEIRQAMENDIDTVLHKSTFSIPADGELVVAHLTFRYVNFKLTNNSGDNANVKVALVVIL
jgi:hypothetical protein